MNNEQRLMSNLEMLSAQGIEVDINSNQSLRMVLKKMKHDKELYRLICDTRLIASRMNRVQENAQVMKTSILEQEVNRIFDIRRGNER